MTGFRHDPKNAAGNGGGDCLHLLLRRDAIMGPGDDQSWNIDRFKIEKWCDRQSCLQHLSIGFRPQTLKTFADCHTRIGRDRPTEKLGQKGIGECFRRIAVVERPGTFFCEALTIFKHWR